MKTILLTIYALIGIGSFLMAFLQDKPSTKRLFKIIAGIFLVTFPFIMTDWVGALNTTLIFCILAIGLNILLGNAGQISLGHAAFYAIGSFSAGFFTISLGLPFFLSILFAGIVVAMVGFVIGTPILRLKGHFLAIATLGLHVVVENLIKSKIILHIKGDKMPGDFMIGEKFKGISEALKGLAPEQVAGAAENPFRGFNSFPSPGLAPEQVVGAAEKGFFDSIKEFINSIKEFISSYATNIGSIGEYFVSLIILILLVFMARNILRTKVGRALSALRDSEVAARALGVNLAVYKNIAFALSAFFAGVAGAIYAHTTGSYDPFSYQITISLNVLAMIVIGGLGSIQGAIIGAALFKMLDMKVLRSALKLVYADSSHADSSPLPDFFLGAMLILVILFAPKGIVYMLYQLKLKILHKRG